MNKKNLICYLVFLLFSVPVLASQIRYNLFSQSLYLGKAHNLISQSFFRGDYDWSKTDLGQSYLGIYWDTDTRSDSTITYTDKQITPYLGHQSNNLFGLPIRAFAELRMVDRTGLFPDNRTDKITETRFGLIGHKFSYVGERQFLEGYGALFYSSLYSDEVLFLGWLKHGVRYSDVIKNMSLDFLHELSFELNRFVQPNNTYVDYLPGMRFGLFKPGWQIYLHQQYAITVQERPGNRNPELRTMLVIAGSI
jgi:hypothetical protein